MTAGMCHSGDPIQRGDAMMRFPVVGGHEGAGIVDAVGEGVTRVEVGDHVVCSFIPACGRCRYCSTGRRNLCDEDRNASTGMFPDGTFRFHENGADFGGLCVLGTFLPVRRGQRVLRHPDSQDVPFETAALVGCGVPIGWGSAGTKRRSRWPRRPTWTRACGTGSGPTRSPSPGTSAVSTPARSSSWSTAPVDTCSSR